MVSGGGIVITVMGRRSENPSTKECCRLWELLANSLSDMVQQGLVQGETLDSFNFPIYNPSCTELRNIIKAEGSFHLDLLETFEVNWDPKYPEMIDNPFNKVASAQNVANSVRAVSESIIMNHFGEDIIDELFRRYGEHVAEQFRNEKIRHVNLVMYMTKKQ